MIDLNEVKLFYLRLFYNDYVYTINKNLCLFGILPALKQPANFVGGIATAGVQIPGSSFVFLASYF